MRTVTTAEATYADERAVHSASRLAMHRQWSSDMCGGRVMLKRPYGGGTLFANTGRRPARRCNWRDAPADYF
jgi:hypothetical protein